MADGPRQDPADTSAPQAEGSTPPSEGSTEAERRAKAERLREAGIDPFPRSFPNRTRIAEIFDAHDPEQLGAGDHDEFSYRVAGRLTGQRIHGKTMFFDVRDLSGSIQAYARADTLGEEAYARIEELDIGDIVGVEGGLYVTKRGQLALNVGECTLLAKALRDPPDLFHGISDIETRYRQRELDLMANERSREVFLMRSKVLTAIRGHMNEHGYVELETPILQRLTGGAAARPFKTHHHALDRHLFLRIATELYLKRAIVGGFEDVYELGRFFRNEGMSPQHNP
jgi:lysyl-tRNA synthetase, class II